MDKQTLGLVLITLGFSGFPAVVLIAMKNNRLSARVMGLAGLVSAVILSVGTLYLLGKLK